MFFELARQQVPACNLELFIEQIARHLDDLHAVKQRPRNA